MKKPAGDGRLFPGTTARVVAVVALLAAGGWAGAADGRSAPGARGLTDTAASPHVAVRSVGLGEVQWTHGFWKSWSDTCRTAIVPGLWRTMRGTEHSQFLHNFLIAAGRAEGRHRGPAFNDGDFYKWLEAAAAVYAVTHDPALVAPMDEAVLAIRQAQRPDGYIHTPVLIRQRQGDATAQPFQDRLGFEMYNLGHLMTAACVHYRATGKADLLDAARKAADFLDRTFATPAPDLAHTAVCPSHYMGLVELYRTTREPRYLELAKKLIALRDQVPDGTDDNQDRVPLRKQTRAVGHAVRANYLYAGVADLYAETGDRSLLGPLQAVWENVVTEKMYITGGCGALYDGASPDGSKDQKHISRVHQAYGREYQLPNSTAHNETCAAVGSVLWNWRMLQITGDAKYADVLERVLYNAAPAGVSLDGTKFFYTNTLRQLDQMPVELRWPRTRQPFLSSFCCPPNIARTVAEAGSYAYGKSDEGVWIHLYGGSELTTDLPGGVRLKLTQETDYPWDDRVKVTVSVDRPATFAVRLRIPGWAGGAIVAVNGQPQPGPPKPGTYCEVRRAWSSGDVIELTLPLRPRLLEAHPLVEEARNQVAVQRGPIVYCLESTDLPAGVSVQDVALPAGIDLRPRFDAGLLGGVTMLEGKATAYPNRPWSRELYRDVAPAAPRPVDLRLIPYYAWGNRGKSAMSVWLPLAR
jgi:DUF1680 family protein